MSHSAISPSGANRWLNCQDKLAILPSQKQTEYAIEGSIAHELAENLLNDSNVTFSTSVNAEMLNYITKYTNYVSNIESDAHLVETQLKIDIIDGWGTADYIAVKKDHLHIVDLKYGRGKRVKCSDPQLKLYAYGAIKLYDSIQSIKTVTMHIVQPRINSTGVYESTTMPANEILKWAEEVVVPAVKELKAGTGKQKTGEWCWFCPGKHLCSEQAQRYFE